MVIPLADFVYEDVYSRLMESDEERSDSLALARVERPLVPRFMADDLGVVAHVSLSVAYGLVVGQASYGASV